MAAKRLLRQSSAPVKIRVQGAKAELHGVDPGRVLPECLRFRNPKARYSEAYQRGDWDGMVDLFSGREFPAGLTQRVVERLTAMGETVEVVEVGSKQEIDLSRLTPTYIDDPSKKDFRLRPHQMDGARALLENVRGIVKAPTGSGKTEIMAVAARYLWEELGWRTLVVEPLLGVANQTARRFEVYYQGDVRVGVLAEGRRDVGPVTVATAQTLLGFKPHLRRKKGSRRSQMVPADPLLREVVQEFEVLMFDECHRTSSDSWFEIAQASGAYRRFGLSATPIVDEDLRDAKLIGATGPLLYDAKSVDMIAQGYAARPKIVMVMSEAASGPALPVTVQLTMKHGRTLQRRVPLPYREAYEQGVVKNEHHNRAVLRAIEWLVDHKRQTLVLCRRKDHFVRLADLMEERGIAFLAVWGATETSDRDHAKRAFASRSIQVVLATTIWDEGEDVGSIDAIVLAEGVKVSTNSRQRVGRGMRPDSEDVWVVDFVPTSHPKLIEHAYQRARAYEEEGYEVRVLESWPEGDEANPEDLLPFVTWDV